MDLREEKIEGVTVVGVKGRIDSATAPALGKSLTDNLGALNMRIVLDLSQLEYISSAGFRILLVAARRAEETGSRLVLCGVAGKVKQLFDLGGFLDLFTIAATREEGIASVN